MRAASQGEGTITFARVGPSVTSRPSTTPKAVWRSTATQSPQPAWFGERLFVAEHTVDVHIGRILGHTGLHQAGLGGRHDCRLLQPARARTRDETQMHFSPGVPPPYAGSNTSV